MAGSKVGKISRWRSMPSKTNINFLLPSNKSRKCTTKALILSHLPSIFFLVSLSFSVLKVASTAASARSNR